MSKKFLEDNKDKKFDVKDEDKKCAPDNIYNNNTCFTIESLTKMATAYNKKINEKKMTGEIIEIKNNKKHLVSELTNRLQNVCDNQICWLKQDFIKELRDENIQEKTFRPVGPQAKFAWLSTTNINDVMEQYEKKYSNFKYYGAVPIDFDNLEQLGIRNINFDDLLKKNINKLGFIFNFDEHWQDGSHWVSMFVDIAQDQIYYFDSYGHKPKKQIKTLVNRIAKWCYNRHILKQDDMESSMTEQSFMNPKRLNYIEQKIKTIKFNKIRHQFKYSECGTYSINFILRLLKGETFEFICDNITKDDTVNKCRETYFRFE